MDLLAIIIMAMTYFNATAAESLQFEQFTPDAGLSHVSIGSDGVLYGVNSAREVWYYDEAIAPKWSQTPGYLSDVSIGNRNNIWGVNGHAVYECIGYGVDPETNINYWTQIQGGLSQLSVGSNGDVLGVNSGGEMYQYNVNFIDGGWKQKIWLTYRQTYHAGFKQISVGSNADSCVGVDTQNYIFQIKDNVISRISSNNGYKYVDISTDGDIYAVDVNGILYHYESNEFKKVDVEPSIHFNQIECDDGVIIGVDAYSKIWKAKF